MMSPSEIESLTRLFAPHEALLAGLLARWDGAMADGDGSHDRSHLMRVWNLVCRIAATVPGTDMEVLAVATLLHDCVAVEKNSPQRAMASRLSADVARGLLRQAGWHEDRTEAVAHAIEAHSFSANIEPRSKEAAILRDADRLDALGALGIARVLSPAGWDCRSTMRTTRSRNAARSTTGASRSTISRPSCSSCRQACSPPPAARSAASVPN